MIKDVIEDLRNELPPTVKLVAVSKFHPFDAIVEAYDAGQRIFAESRPQELFAKEKERIALMGLRSDASGCGSGDTSREGYMSDLQWHFIGHLQTNKLKMVLPYVSLVQSVDSLHLLEAIDRWGRDNGKVTDILIECHISADQTKQGFSEAELEAFAASDASYPYVRVRGVMGMASLTDDIEVIRGEFRRLVSLLDMLRKREGSVFCNEISMGMSDDYRIAVEEGSTMVRIGSLIFGSRN
ncbi:MAG: YggS family pyridoxal phosphate-dependent enzyme [Candidatus Cryptobacteroides sp.]